MAEESNHAGAPVGDSECVICTEPAKYRCPECMERDYCSRDCQVLDWKEKGHKRSCPRTARYWASHKQIAPAPQQQQEKEKEIETTKQNDEQTNKQTGGQEKVDSPHLQPQPRQRGLQNVAEPGTLETERVQPTSVVPNPPIANSQPTQPQSKGYVLSPRITEQGQTRGVSQSQGKGAQAQATLSPTPAIHRSPHLPVRQNSTPRPLAAKPQKSPLATHPPTTECHKSTGFPLTMPSNQDTSSEQPTGVTLESFLAHQQQQLREHLPAPLSPSAPTQQKSHPHPAPSDAHPPTRTHAQPSAPAPQAAQDYARGRDMFMRMFGPTAPPAAPPVDILPLPTDPFADIELDPPFDNSSRKRQRIDSRAPTTHPPPEKPPADDDEFCTLADMLPEQENEQASAKHTEGGQGGTGGRAGRQPGAMQNSGLGGPGASMGLQRQRSVNTGPKRRQPLLVFPRQATFFGPFAFEAMVQHQSQHMHQHQAQMAQPVMQQQPAEG